MTRDEHRQASLDALLDAERHETVLKATVEMYKVALDDAASATHAAAHNTLDSLLDAKRRQNYHFIELIRKAGE